MDLAVVLELAAFAVLMLLSGFFSSSETSLFSLNSRLIEQMRREANPSVGLIERLLSQPRRLIVTILIGNELVNVAASVISAVLVIQFIGAENKWMNLFIMVPILLLVGEITPKTLAIRNNVAFASFQARYIELFAMAITPVRFVVRHVAEVFITVIAGTERSADNIITEDMVRSLTQEAVGEGTLDSHEARYINRIFDFGNLTLRDIVTPRSQVQFLRTDQSLGEMAVKLGKTRHTKVPVYDSDRDRVIGVLFARDLLGVEKAARDSLKGRRSIARLLRKAHFVPETKSAADLFHDFRHRKLSVALTLDEFGGITGLVTMEDLLECIFGEIHSASEVIKANQLEVSKLEDDRYRIEGSMTIERFNAMAKSNIIDGEFETIGGMLLHAFGELPVEGDSVDLKGFTFSIASVDSHRIGDVIVQALPTGVDDIRPEPDDDDDEKGEG